MGLLHPPIRQYHHQQLICCPHNCAFQHYQVQIIAKSKNSRRLQQKKSKATKDIHLKNAAVSVGPNEKGGPQPEKETASNEVKNQNANVTTKSDNPSSNAGHKVTKKDNENIQSNKDNIFTAGMRRRAKRRIKTGPPGPDPSSSPGPAAASSTPPAIQRETTITKKDGPNNALMAKKIETVTNKIKYTQRKSMEPLIYTLCIIILSLVCTWIVVYYRKNIDENDPNHADTGQVYDDVVSRWDLGKPLSQSVRTITKSYDDLITPGNYYGLSLLKPLTGTYPSSCIHVYLFHCLYRYLLTSS